MPQVRNFFMNNWKKYGLKKCAPSENSGEMGIVTTLKQKSPPREVAQVEEPQKEDEPEDDVEKSSPKKRASP